MKMLFQSDDKKFESRIPLRHQQCHSVKPRQELIKLTTENTHKNLFNVIVLLSLPPSFTHSLIVIAFVFPQLISGAKPQIISTAVCTNIQMELCDAWTWSHGISLSEHVPSHSSLDHVFSVRLKTFYLYLSLSEACDKDIKVLTRDDLSSKETFDFSQLSWKLETAEVENERQTSICSMCTTILPDLTAFIAALLFAVHPIHTEAVSIAFKTSFAFESLCNVQSNSTTL